MKQTIKQREFCIKKNKTFFYKQLFFWNNNLLFMFLLLFMDVFGIDTNQDDTHDEP